MTQVAYERIVRRQGLAAELEALIDRHGLYDVLSQLDTVCDEKAGHVLTNWQDRGLARQWSKAGEVCGNAARKVLAIDLP